MWTYQQSTGNLLDGEGRAVTTGYAGNGWGKNNPQAQDQHDVGPLPCGKYKIGEPYASPKTGAITMNLTPDPGNEMFGRAGFRIHGDSLEHPGNASDGCMCIERPYRMLVAASPDKDLEVIP
jgi:hypothetical protein